MINGRTVVVVEPDWSQAIQANKAWALILLIAMVIFLTIIVKKGGEG